MAEGRQRHDWDQMSVLLALIANCHRDPKKAGPFQWQQFHPMEAAARRTSRGIRLHAGNIQILRKLFVRPQNA